MPARLTTIFTRRSRSVAAPDGVVEVVEEVSARPDAPADPYRMRRERRSLARHREIEIRDVGGLAVEMVRRDRWKPDLLIARADDVLAVEQRMHELDSRLAAENAARAYPNVAHCRCGAPVPPGVHFCSHCGRPAATSPPVVACAHCGQPLPADSNFCGFCGNSAAEQYVPLGDPIDDTVIRPAGSDPEMRS